MQCVFIGVARFARKLLYRGGFAPPFPPNSAKKKNAQIKKKKRERKRKQQEQSDWFLFWIFDCRKGALPPFNPPNKKEASHQLILKWGGHKPEKKKIFFPSFPVRKKNLLFFFSSGLRNFAPPKPPPAPGVASNSK